MPSVVLGNPHASGSQCVISGVSFWSGVKTPPVGTIQLFWQAPGGGSCFISFSGSNPPLSGGFMTVTSGAMLLSGGCNSGMLDGMQLINNTAYSIPKMIFNQSGLFNLNALTDTAGSGGRLFFEFF